METLETKKISNFNVKISGGGRQGGSFEGGGGRRKLPLSPHPPLDETLADHQTFQLTELKN